MPKETLSPPQPAFVLRGHSTPLHALHFTEDNRRLISGDADGWVVSWNLAYKRPVAVWKAHTSALLGLASWGFDRVITHGRDNKLLIWQLSEADESQMEKALPVDNKDVCNSTAVRQPWLLHAIPVNAMNFCSFAMCLDGLPQPKSSKVTIKDRTRYDPILVAVPNAIDSSGIDIFQFPSRVRAAVIHKDRELNTGMIMALGIATKHCHIQVAAGYESGHTMVFVQRDPGAAFEKLYSAQTHVQPILSLTFSPYPNQTTYITSSADATIAIHPLPLEPSIFKNTTFKPLKTINTKHAGQQGLSYRSDGRIFATAGWDGHCRVYSGKTGKEVASLKWMGGCGGGGGSGGMGNSKESGSYCTAFAAVMPSSWSLSSSQIHSTAGQAGHSDPADNGHLSDANGRAKDGTNNDQHQNQHQHQHQNENDHGKDEDDTENMVNASENPPQQRSKNESTTNLETMTTISTTTNGNSVQVRRQEKAQMTHWLAVGSKDGKITLWDIF